MIKSNKYKVYTEHNFRSIPQIEQYLNEDQKLAVEVVGKVLPFKVDNYVINQLIDWNNVPDDPIYRLTFPHKAMLSTDNYFAVLKAINKRVSPAEISVLVNKIRFDLNPHPSGQIGMNVPNFQGSKLWGMQHKYDQTVLFFPHHGQTCHSFCTFCFRWPQFVGINHLKFAMKKTQILIEYVKSNPKITDILFTGGDPMTMSSQRFQEYMTPILEAEIPHLQTIRIGSKSLSYWPYRFISDKDSDDLLRFFEKIIKSGYHLSFMAHLNHPNELKTKAVQEAIKRIQNTGTLIRTQSPILNHINNKPSDWIKLWNIQVKLGCVPYYMFIPRNTGAQNYFAIPLVKAWEIFTEATQNVSGIARTVRGPSMSCTPGKIRIDGVPEIKGEKYFALSFIQGRNSKWVNKPFYAKYDEKASWLNHLIPAFNEKSFFFEQDT